MTHNEIVKTAAKWLKKHKDNMSVPNCSLVVDEIKAANKTGEIPDVIGWCYCASVVVEAKTSHPDFLKDKKKLFRGFGGMGEYRYFCCPANLIKIEDLPSKWGLLYCDDLGQITIIKKSEFFIANVGAERAMLLSIIRRTK